jgi:hypothetical protein
MFFLLESQCRKRNETCGASQNPIVSFSWRSSLMEHRSTKLGVVLKTFSRDAGEAQEIAAYRQAALAVVLPKTQEGSGSGVVLQNGLILTNS